MTQALTELYVFLNLIRLGKLFVLLTESFPGQGFTLDLGACRFLLSFITLAFT